MSQIKVLIARRDLYDKDTYDPINLNLPAEQYEIRDALHKARIYDGDNYVIFDPECKMEFLSNWMTYYPNLAELNFLAKRLDLMKSEDKLHFEVLVKSEKEVSDIQRLINLTYNIDSVHLISNIGNDSELGKFYFENDFITELEDLPNTAEKYLDFSKIGEEMRKAENGVYLKDGEGRKFYGCNMNGDIQTIYNGVDLSVENESESYIFRLELDNDEGKTCFLELPCDEKSMQNVLEELNAKSFDDCFINNYRSIILQLSERFSPYEDIVMINDLARSIEKLESDRELAKYKAVLEFADCTDLETAIKLVNNLNDFTFDKNTISAEDYAKDYFASYDINISCEAFRYFDYRSYGEYLIKKERIFLSEYGAITKNDDHTIKSINQNESIDESAVTEEKSMMPSM